MDAPREVKFLFADGGVILKNPSTIGGTWAWCGVSASGEHIREVGGYLLPNTSTCPGWPRVGSRTVTNNESEFYAALRAIESMPAGWSGMLVCDSKITLDRMWQLMQGEHLTAFRSDWQVRACRALQRSDGVRLVHVAGHPTIEDQWRGFTFKDGKKVRVSRHNVWCDKRCTELARDYERNLDWSDAFPDLAPPTPSQATAA